MDKSIVKIRSITTIMDDRQVTRKPNEWGNNDKVLDKNQVKERPRKTWINTIKDAIKKREVT